LLKQRFLLYSLALMIACIATAFTITAAAAGSSDSNLTTEESDNSTASVQVTLTADRQAASPHETVTFTYTILNSGDVTVSKLILTDEKLGEIQLPTDNLTQNAKLEVTGKYTVHTSDLPGTLTNTATVKIVGQDGQTTSFLSNTVSIALTVNNSLMTKAELLKLSGVPGKGIDKAPGLQKQYNSNSEAVDHAGKKDKDKSDDE
jgi:hypothetical protein